MSTAKDAGKETEASKVADFILANVGGKFLRFQTIDLVPEGSETLTAETIQKMTKAEIGELYGKLVGVNSKNFKDHAIAVESLNYQVGKMPIFDPSAPIQAPTAPSTKGRSSAPTDKAARKVAETFELLVPAEADKALKELAPQARTLVEIMTELAAEKNSTKFSGAELTAKLMIPEVSARLRTRQDPLRILQYYKGKLIGSGFIRTS